MVGADLANIVNEACLLAARKGKKQVEMEDFEEAVDRIIAGLERKNRYLSAEEKRRVAYHETGHALVAASHNPALAELYDYFSHAVGQTIEQTETNTDLPEPSQEDHELLLAAVRRQDETRAENLARELLKPSLQALKRQEP